MLVLSRMIDQSIVISGRITITVKKLSRNRVTLAFDAPREVQILRSELSVFNNGVDDLDHPLATTSLGNVESNLASQ